MGKGMGVRVVEEKNPNGLGGRRLNGKRSGEDRQGMKRKKGRVYGGFV